MKHIVNLVVSQPDHEFVSMRARRHEKTYIQEASSEKEAINRASRHFKGLGFYVHGASIVEQKAPETPKQEITESALGVMAAQSKQEVAKKKAQAEVDKSEVEQKAGKAQAGSALAQYLKNKASTMKEEVEVTSGYLEEKLSAGDPASKWIHDFVHSDNPKFEGKSKAERIKMALGAKYAADRAVKEEAELEEGRAMDYKMSRSTIAGDRGKSRGGEITVPQKDREEIARILAKEEPNKSEQDAELEEAVSRKHFQQVADLIKSNPDEAKRKELAQHHAEIFAGQNPRFDRSRFYAAAGVKLEEAKADPVAKAKELLDQAEKGTYKGSAAKLQKALEKAKSRSFDQGKGYKLEEDAEQLDETGAVKKLNKSLKNLNLRSKGARALIGSGLTAQNLNLKNKKGEYLKQRDVNLAAGRTLSAGNLEEGSEGTAPTTPKEKELAAKAGDPNKITKKDVLAARGVKLDEVKGSFKDQATEKAEDKRLKAANKAIDAAKKTRKTVIGGDVSHKINTSPTTGDASKTLGVGGK